MPSGSKFVEAERTGSEAIFGALRDGMLYAFGKPCDNLREMCLFSIYRSEIAISYIGGNEGETSSAGGGHKGGRR